MHEAHPSLGVQSYYYILGFCIILHYIGMIDCPYGDLRLQLRQASLTAATLNRIINLSGVASPAQARPALI